MQITDLEKTLIKLLIANVRKLYSTSLHNYTDTEQKLPTELMTPKIDDIVIEMTTLPMVFRENDDDKMLRCIGKLIHMNKEEGKYRIRLFNNEEVVWSNCEFLVAIDNPWKKRWMI